MRRKRKVLNTDVYPMSSLGYNVETAGSPTVRLWQTMIIRVVKDKIKERISKCSLKLDFYISEQRIWKLDIDNLTKPVLDALKETGIYYDDTDVYNAEITKNPVDQLSFERLHIELWEWGENEEVKS